MGLGIRLSDTTLERFAWQERALCATQGGDFFPAGPGVKKAKAVCASGCEVREQCLAYALENGCDGVWGGTSTKERRLMRGSDEVVTNDGDRED